MAKQAQVETKAVFVRSVAGGKTFYRKMPFTIEVRDYTVKDSTDTRGRQTYFNLGNGPPPGRALAFNTSKGELYDAIEYFDVYPTTWPRVGLIAD
jgi:hypothetical protein